MDSRCRQRERERERERDPPLLPVREADEWNPDARRDVRVEFLLKPAPLLSEIKRHFADSRARSDSRDSARHICVRSPRCTRSDRRLPPIFLTRASRGKRLRERLDRPAARAAKDLFSALFFPLALVFFLLPFLFGNAATIERTYVSADGGRDTFYNDGDRRAAV